MSKKNDILIHKENVISHKTSNISKEYTFGKTIGEGAFGKVRLAVHKATKQTRAVKILPKSKIDMEALKNEVSILSKLTHPNIMQIYEIFDDKTNMYIVSEYCQGGELFDIIEKKGNFTEKDACTIMKQLMGAICYSHQNNIVHKDLKPENILMDKEKDDLAIKIIDWGCAELVKKKKQSEHADGTIYYIAPEVLRGEYNEKCDIWSCGVILYILLSGRPPFGGDNDKEIMERVAIGKYDLQSAPFNKISKNCIDLIQKLLIMEPKKRITAQDALNHPWFKDHKSKELFNQIKDESTLKKLIANLKAYKRDSVIQETALAYLVHNFPQMKDVVNACKLFNQIDVNGDGKINKNELLKGLQSKIKSDTLAQDVEQIYKNIDMDNNGYIEYEEFVRAAVSKERFINENVLRFAFRYFDKDGSGEITFDEIEAVFKESVADKNKVHESLSQIIKEVDANGDGIISFNEFSDIMKKMLKK
jgi:calcium-dependent protein kinase